MIFESWLPIDLEAHRNGNCNARGHLPIGLGPRGSFTTAGAANLFGGTVAAISNSHFAPPIEVTDLFRAPVNSSSSWMVCIRSAQSSETMPEIVFRPSSRINTFHLAIPFSTMDAANSNSTSLPVLRKIRRQSPSAFPLQRRAVEERASKREDQGLRPWPGKSVSHPVVGLQGPD